MSMQLQERTGSPLAQAVAFTGDISPSEITADQHNYAPTGHATASVFRLTANGGWTITGLAGGTDGRIVILQNIGSNPLFIADQSGSSDAANQFITPYNAWSLLVNGGGVILQYDGTASRWRVISIPSNKASQSDMEAGSANSVTVSPGRQHYHPSAAKCWVVGTPNSTTIIVSYNVTSLGDTNTGQQTVTIATDFSSANYCVQVTVDDSSATISTSATVTGRAAGSYIMNSVDEAASGADPTTAWHSVAFGDQA
jgi:hypothetical protein